MAKVIVWELLSNIHIMHPRAGPTQFIDDLGQDEADSSPDIILSELVAAAVPLARGLAALRLPVASKACVVASSQALGAALVEALNKEGIPFHLTQSGRDLGVEAVGGRRRAGSLVTKRFLKAKPRAIRGGVFASRNRSASKLFTTGALPAATWGHQAHGLAPSRVAATVRLAALGTGLAGGGSVRLPLLF